MKKAKNSFRKIMSLMVCESELLLIRHWDIKHSVFESCKKSDRVYEAAAVRAMNTCRSNEKIKSSDIKVGVEQRVAAHHFPSKNVSHHK